MSTAPVNLFSHAGVSMPAAMLEPVDRLLAAPAARTALDNLPADVGEAFVLGYVVAVDGSGPAYALSGTTLARWGAVKRVIADAWHGKPTCDRPGILSMKLPALDKARRQRIAKIARELAEAGQ